MVPLNNTVNDPRAYSPLTMGLEWSRLGRLIFMVICATLGSVLNGFLVASFIVQKSLQKTGNIFVCCTGLADLLITTTVIPTCSVIVLSGQWEVDTVCYALHFIAMSSTYGYSVFFMLVSMDNYIRICRSPAAYKRFKSCGIAIWAIFVFILCFATAGAGVYMNLGNDYCLRAHTGNLHFRVTTAIVFQFIPFIVTIFCLSTAAAHVRYRASKHVKYKRSYVFENDRSSTTLNIVTYTVFVLAWAPYLILVYLFPNSSDGYFYNFVWLGLSRSVITSSFYVFLSEIYRITFNQLFNYCFCKNGLSSYYNNRHRRGHQHRATGTDIRVHIMHQAICASGASRYSSSSRETQEL